MKAPSTGFAWRPWKPRKEDVQGAEKRRAASAGFGAEGAGGMHRRSRGLPALLANLSLARRFLVVSLAIVVVGGFSVAFLLGQLIETSAINRTTDVTALYVESFVAPQLQSLRTNQTLTPAEIDSLQALMKSGFGQRIETLKIWSTSGTILYCPTLALVGRTFPMTGDRGRAAQGAVTGDISDLSAPENVYERQHWSQLLEIYMPIRASGSSLIIAVAELYQDPTDLLQEVNHDRLMAWGFVAVAALLAFLALAVVVRQGSRRITRQDAELRSRVRELSGLLAQNAELHDRLRAAAARTTTLNELERRRIGADLHDGPSQTLAFAMLRLGAVDGTTRRDVEASAADDRDLESVRTALDEALREMRAIAAGLRGPEMEHASPAEVVRRAVREHERRSNIRVKLRLDDLPDTLPLATKIALYRIVSEALSNASRHGKGLDVAVCVGRSGGGMVVAEISDAGPGFDVRQRRKEGHLGLAGIKERAELLGGRMELESKIGHGTRIRVYLPVAESSETADSIADAGEEADDPETGPAEPRTAGSEGSR